MRQKIPNESVIGRNLPVEDGPRSGAQASAFARSGARMSVFSSFGAISRFTADLPARRRRANFDNRDATLRHTNTERSTAK
jgi:hypothetical protein